MPVSVILKPRSLFVKLVGYPYGGCQCGVGNWLCGNGLASYAGARTTSFSSHVAVFEGSCTVEGCQHTGYKECPFYKLLQAFYKQRRHTHLLFCNKVIGRQTSKNLVPPHPVYPRSKRVLTIAMLPCGLCSCSGQVRDGLQSCLVQPHFYATTTPSMTLKQLYISCLTVTCHIATVILNCSSPLLLVLHSLFLLYWEGSATNHACYTRSVTSASGCGELLPFFQFRFQEVRLAALC